MALSDAQIVAIRKSWAFTAQNGPLAAQLFYAQLFKIAPHTRALFRDDMREQQRKLISTLGFVVEHLDRLDIVGEAARALALRHVSYGVTADQYAPVGAALIWTLKHLLGPRFKAAEEEAWTAAYDTIAAVMIEAAYGEKEQA